MTSQSAESIIQPNPMSAKRVASERSGKLPKPLPVLLCPPHDTEFSEFNCVCELSTIKAIISQGQRSEASKKEIYFQIAVALTPSTYEGRRVILPHCIRNLMASSFPSVIPRTKIARKSKGPRAVIVTHLRRTASMSALELTVSISHQESKGLPILPTTPDHTP